MSATTTTTTLTLVVACERNLDAIALMRVGLEREAIFVFDLSRTALSRQVLGAELKSNNSSSSCSDVVAAGTMRLSVDGDHIHMTASATAPPPFTCASIPITRASTRAIASRDRGNYWSRPSEPTIQYVFAIFNEAFTLDLAHDLSRSAWVHCTASITIVMLYNAGLACHRLAIYGCSVSLFHSALHYYRQSFHLLDAASRMPRPTSEMDILFMALVNNMGHCFERLDKRSGMLWCYRELCHKYHATQQKHRLTTDNRQFFQDRIRLGQEFSRQPAPAA